MRSLSYAGSFAFGEVVRRHLGLGGIDRLVTRHLVGDRVGAAQVLLDDAEHFLFQCRIVDSRELARLLGGLLGEIDDRLDHRLEVTMAEHHSAEHDLLGKLLGLQLDHQHRVRRSGHDEVELAFGHLFQRRVEDVFVVGEADARGADRPLERRARQAKRGRRSDQREDVGIVLQVVRQRRHDHLRLVAPAVGEQRTDRAVDQARNQRFLFGRTAFALEVSARNAARRIILFLVVDGQRQEVDAFARLLGGDNCCQNLGLSVGGDDSAVGLARDLARLEC